MANETGHNTNIKRRALFRFKDSNEIPKIILLIAIIGKVDVQNKEYDMIHFHTVNNTILRFAVI